MNKRLIILIVLCSIAVIPAFSGQLSIFPFLRNSNVNKITQKVISGKESDSAKVHAIHDWITEHIKYDLKKFQNFDFRKVPVKKILKKRKAICKGYSDLFNEMCSIAGVQSTYVSGYVKDIYYDYRDKFYQDEHVWNAAFYNNRWHLIDVTWDSGYECTVKKTVLGKILYFITLHRYTIFKYKPHFVTSPTDLYFDKSGYFFKFDHIPANPVWQMVSPMCSVEKAEKDTMFYLVKVDSVTPSAQSSALDFKRSELAAMDETERTITDGFAIHEYNHKNHLPRAQSYMLKAIKQFRTIDAQSYDTIKVIAQCDSVLDLLQKSKDDLDSNFIYLSTQKAELSANNRKKHDIMAMHFRKLARSTSKCETQFRSGKSICDQSEKSANRMNSDNYRMIRRLYDVPAYDNSKNGKKTNPVDSALAITEIKLYQDSIKICSEKIRKQMDVCDTIFYDIISSFNYYAFYSQQNRQLAIKVHYNRLNGFDDLDLHIRMFKDTILKYKFPADTIILDTTGKILVKQLQREFLKLGKDFSKLLKYHINIVNRCAALKRSCYAEDNSSVIYRQTLDSFAVRIRIFSRDLNDFSNKFSYLQGYCNDLKKMAKKENKVYKEEKTTEDALFYSRQVYINRHFRSRALFSSEHKRIVRDFTGLTQKIRGKYYKTR